LRGAFPAFSYKQANSSLYGVDGYFDWHVSPVFTFDVTFSVVRGVNNETGEPLFQMPADRLRLTGSIFLPSTRVFQNPYFDLTGTFVRRQDRFQPNVDYLDPPPGYALLDAGAGSDLLLGAQVLHVNISVRNLLNKGYRDYLSRFRYYVDEPGRDFIVRLQIPLGRFEE
jgi:iron complex outermembrane receptor protein